MSLALNCPHPLSVWLHLSPGAVEEKSRNEQCKMFLAFILYI